MAVGEAECREIGVALTWDAPWCCYFAKLPIGCARRGHGPASLSFFPRLAIKLVLERGDQVVPMIEGLNKTEPACLTVFGPIGASGHARRVLHNSRAILDQGERDCPMNQGRPSRRARDTPIGETSLGPEDPPSYTGLGRVSLISPMDTSIPRKKEIRRGLTPQEDY